MTPFSLLPFAAAACSVPLALASVLRNSRSPAAWFFSLGMLTLAADSTLAGLGLRAADLAELEGWLTRSLIAESFVPVAWLGFSLTYSRGDRRASLARWTAPLAVLGLAPIVIAVGFQERLLDQAAVGPAGEFLQLQFSRLGTALNVVLLVALVLILMNLEQTIRSAVGTMRWRIKFVVLGLAIVFGARVYVRSQAILFSAPDPFLWGVEASALLIGCAFLVVAYARAGFAEIEVYPSRAVMRSSLTVILVGAYLFAVGVLAQLARRFGGADSFQLQALVVLVGLAGLATLLLSDRLRQRIQEFVGRHFRKAQHDSVRIWTEFSRQLTNVKDRGRLCAASARLISETFEVLSVSVWLLDEHEGRLQMGASTSARAGSPRRGGVSAEDRRAIAAGLRGRQAPFNLEPIHDAWAGKLRDLNPATFPNGGDRWCVPLNAAGRSLGVLVLADRVTGARYTAEDLELLRCIGDQVTSVLVNLGLANQVARARELEAFRTMSAFFVHDLKNAAASLNLMLKNLPVHFDDPAFRQDALRGLGNAARRIDEMIARLSAVRQQRDIKPVETDLRKVLEEALDSLPAMPGVVLTRAVQALPPVKADPQQIRSLVTNLVLNARDAIAAIPAGEPASGDNGARGRIAVRAECDGSDVRVRVEDDGCGMSAAFLEECLFRPFQSTKKDGLGIGMFQARTIVEAHGGTIAVDSRPGEGTTVSVSLPVEGVR